VGGVYDLQWSRGKYLAVLSTRDPALTVWDLETGRATTPVRGHGGRQGKLAWCPDGKRFAWSTPDSVKIYAATGEELRTLPIDGRRGTVVVFSFAWSPDGRTLAAGASPGRVTVWDAARGSALATFDGGPALCWSPDSRRLYAVVQDGTVKVWDRRARELTSTFKLPVKPAAWLLGSDSRAIVCRFSPKGDQLLIASPSGEVFLLDPVTGRTTRTLNANRPHLRSSPPPVAWDAGGRRVTWVSEGVIKVWDARTGKELLSKDDRRKDLAHLALTPDGRLLAMRTRDGRIMIRNLATGRERVLTAGEPVVAWRPDGKCLAVSGTDGVVVHNTADPRTEVVRTLFLGAKRTPPGASPQCPLGQPARLESRRAATGVPARGRHGPRVSGEYRRSGPHPGCGPGGPPRGTLRLEPGRQAPRHGKRQWGREGLGCPYGDVVPLPAWLDDTPPHAEMESRRSPVSRRVCLTLRRLGREGGEGVVCMSAGSPRRPTGGRDCLEPRRPSEPGAATAGACQSGAPGAKRRPRRPAPGHHVRAAGPGPGPGWHHRKRNYDPITG
jgi:hypothetical protein